MTPLFGSAYVLPSTLPTAAIEGRKRFLTAGSSARSLMSSTAPAATYDVSTPPPQP
ncbi:hypothetical protein WBK31_02565 [Nonomuraea sp. N2-4H]